MLDLTIASDILTCTKPHISEYYHFILNLICKAIHILADRASDHGIPSSENTKGVKRRYWLMLFSITGCVEPETSRPFSAQTDNWTLTYFGTYIFWHYTIILIL